VCLVSNGQFFDRYKLEIQIFPKVSTGVDGASIGNHLGSLGNRAGVKRDNKSGENKNPCSTYLPVHTPCLHGGDRIARGSPDLKQQNQNHLF
jgi:hypothetical protein